MTLARLRFYAIATPVGVVVALEIVRSRMGRLVPLQERLSLDAVVVVGIVAFSLVIFRFVDNMQDRLKRQNRELLALHSAGMDVASDLTLDTVLDRVVDQARQLVGARYGALSVIDEHGRIDAFVTSGITPEQRSAIGPPPEGHGVLGISLLEGQTLRLEEISHHPRSQGFPANHPVMRSLLAVPLPCKGPFLGNLYLADKTVDEGPFSEDDLQTLQRFAVHAAIAIDNARLHASVADLAIARERLRISHEMHDGLAQVLGYVNTKVQAAEAYLSRGKTAEASIQLHELAASARQAYTDVRDSIVALRTLPGTGSLREILQEYIEKWGEQSAIDATLQVDDELRLRPAVELQLVRIIQEALTNVRKHSRATSARVEIESGDGTLVARVSDNGTGFNTEAPSRSQFPRFGLTTMRERAESISAELQIASRSTGTTITFKMPLDLAVTE